MLLVTSQYRALGLGVSSVARTCLLFQLGYSFSFTPVSVIVACLALAMDCMLVLHIAH